MSGIGSDLLVLLPAYGALERETEELIHGLRAAGCAVVEMRGVGLIDRVRSELASHALTLPFERWLWVDADMAYTVADAARLVETAERHDLDLLSAVYVTRERPARPACVFDPSSEAWPTRNRNAALCGQDGLLYPITRAGFGACVTHRRVFERAAVMLPDVKFPRAPQGKPFFLSRIAGGDYIGEDYSFSDLARETGSTLWADTRVRVGHVGRYVYGWEDAMPRERFANVELTW